MKKIKLHHYQWFLIIGGLIILIAVIIVLTDKSNYLYIDLNNENLIKTSKTKTSILFK